MESFFRSRFLARCPFFGCGMAVRCSVPDSLELGKGKLYCVTLGLLFPVPYTDTVLFCQ